MCKRSVWMVAAARVTQTSGGEFADAEDHRKTCSRALRRATTIHYSSWYSSAARSSESKPLSVVFAAAWLLLIRP